MNGPPGITEANAAVSYAAEELAVNDDDADDLFHHTGGTEKSRR